VTVQDVNRVPTRGKVQGDGQDLCNPVGEKLVWRYEMPGLAGKKGYGFVDWEGYLEEPLLV